MANKRKPAANVKGDILKYSLLVSKSLNQRVEAAMEARHMALSQLIREVLEEYCTRFENGAMGDSACLCGDHGGKGVRVVLDPELTAGVKAAEELLGLDAAGVIQTTMRKHLPEVILEGRKSKARLAECLSS